MKNPSGVRLRRFAVPLATIAALTLSACGGGGGGSEAGDTAADPADVSINLDDCTDPASVTEEITDTFQIGYSAPLSGPVAGAVELATAGYDARIKAENEAGGIDGVQIEVIYKDDAFQPDQAKANGTEFIDSIGVDALATFGTGPLNAMVDDQNAACVPMLYASSSTDEFIDIESFPWTTTILPLSRDEAGFLVDLIQDRYDDDVKVGIAENQTGSGIVQSEAFQEAAKEAGLEITTIVSDVDPVAAATTLKEDDIEVVYHGSVTGTCAAFDIARGRVGYEPDLVLKPSNCVSKVEYIAAGDAAQNIVVGAFGKDPFAPENEGDEGVATYIAQMEAAGVPPEVQGNAVAVSGWTQADLVINTLKQAAASEDGLTRLSVMMAARDQEYEVPMLINGIKWVSTPERLIGINGFRPQTWLVDEQRFAPLEGADIIEIKP